jgi:hypothetical protein
MFFFENDFQNDNIALILLAEQGEIISLTLNNKIYVNNKVNIQEWLSETLYFILACFGVLFASTFSYALYVNSSEDEDQNENAIEND